MEEREIAVDAMRLTLALELDLGASWLDLLRSSVDERLRSLVEAELEAAEVERKLALLLLRQPIETLGVLVELAADLHQSVAADDALARGVSWVQEALERNDAPVDAQTVALVRWQLDLLVALECLQAEVEELAWWSRRCASGGRRVAAMLTRPSAMGRRGEVARLEARSSWDEWDDEELARELSPWPSE